MYELYRNLNMQSEKEHVVPVIITDGDDDDDDDDEEEEEDDGLVFKFPPVRRSPKSSKLETYTIYSMIIRKLKSCHCV